MSDFVEAVLAGKILIDMANPLDFSSGMPPSLSIVNTDSLGEQIQRTYPTLNAVKILNTMNANLMVTPTLLEGDHDLFVSGGDGEAKQFVREPRNPLAGKTRLNWVGFPANAGLR